jgi:hypothetical protein
MKQRIGDIIFGVGVLVAVTITVNFVMRQLYPTTITAQTASTLLKWSEWRLLSTSGGTTAHTATSTTQTYQAANQPNLTIAVFSATGVTAYTVVIETCPNAKTNAGWSEVTTIDFVDDGSIAAPKWQQVSIPGRYGLVRARITAITPGAGSIELWAST